MTTNYITHLQLEQEYKINKACHKLNNNPDDSRYYKFAGIDSGSFGFTEVHVIIGYTIVDKIMPFGNEFKELLAKARSA